MKPRDGLRKPRKPTNWHHVWELVCQIADITYRKGYHDAYNDIRRLREIEMPWTAPKPAPTQLIPAGPQHAVCVWLIDLGIQEQKKFQSDDTELQHQMYVGFEFPDHLIEIEKGEGKAKKRIKMPMVRGRTLKVSMHAKATLNKWAKALMGKENVGSSFDIETMIGANGLINIEHYTSDDGAERVGTIKEIFPLPADLYERKEPKLIPVIYRQEMGNAGDQYNALPEWLKETIDKGLARRQDKAPDEELDDDIPF